MLGSGYGALGAPTREAYNFRLEWAQALFFGSYEVTVSYILVIVSMSYYERQDDLEDGLTHLCGSLLPDWKSVAVIFTFYTLVYLGIVAVNLLFIRSTRRTASDQVSMCYILNHPLGRLLLGLLSFFLTCAFSSTSVELRPVNSLSLILSEVAMVVDAIFSVFFFVCALRRVDRILEVGTRVWIGRQLVFTQLKFAVLVCFLSTHINVVVQALVVFVCNAIIYYFWFRLVKSNRKHKQSPPCFYEE